jgi:Bacteriophage head to tail connecting protein
MLDQFSDDATRRNRYQRIASALWSERSTFDSHWRDLADLFQPRRIRFSTSDRNKGDKRNQNIINSTGRFAARTLQSGLHAGLTSPARPWMKLTLPDRDLSDFGPVREWLHIVSQRMMTIFAVSNVYNTLPIVYGDMGVFGTGAMFVGEDRKELLRCQAFPVGSYALGLDRRGKVATFVRKYQLSVRQVIEEFALMEDGRSIDWSVVSSHVKRAWDNAQYEDAVEVTWLVLPNERHDPDKLVAKFLPWTSVHYEEGQERSDVFLRESGFNEFPIMAPRWDITGEDAYGTDSPGMTALGDNRQLQVMERRKGQAIAKMIDPPLTGPGSLRSQKTSLLPGDVTYQDVREGMQGLRPIHEVRIDLSHLTADIAGVEYRIKRAFYEDLFLMLATSDPYRGAAPPTAREIEERHEEKLLALGPVLERTNDELLDPLVDRTFNLMTRAGLIPPPPPEIEGVELRVEYISILSQAQKLVGVSSADRFLSTFAPLSEVFPEVRAKVNPIMLVNSYADMLGVDPRIIREDDEAEAINAEAQQAQAAQAQAEQVATIAKAARDGANAPMGQDSALDRIATGMTGR